MNQRETCSENWKSLDRKEHKCYWFGKQDLLWKVISLNQCITLSIAVHTGGPAKK